MPLISDEAELSKDLTARLSALGGEQQERLARRRADELDLSYINLTLFPIDPDVIEIVPQDKASQSQAVLFYRQGKDVRLAAVNPRARGVSEVVQFVVDKLAVQPEIFVISHRSLKVALSRYRPQQLEDLPRGEVRISADSLQDFAAGIAELKKLGEHITQLSPTELLEVIVAGAVKSRASDIHLEPQEKISRLRYRIDGVLQDVADFPRSGWRMVLSRIKVLASLKLNIHDTPQDGSFVLRVGEKTYDLRVSVLPGGNGENIVMRILDRATRVASIKELGMKERDYAAVTRELKQSNGLILVTGPTGSGKTTSLASFIQEVTSSEVKVITLEDPIEYRLPGIEQTQVDKTAGYTFAQGLRAILRQDPDVIMVGEIRDAETAATALHAALTGHLVFSTLHTNNAPGSIPRLIDLGAAPNIIAPAINLIIAQRLVRVVCDECVVEYSPDDDVRNQIAAAMHGALASYFNPGVLKDKNLKLVRAGKCQACHGTGYRGRIGLFEVMPVWGKVEELILASADGNSIMAAALADGMTTIAQDGYLKVLEKITTIEEIERVTED